MAAQGSLFAWRAVFAALGVLMVGTLVYTCATDGSPFRPELLTPWMVATLVDFYVNVIAISAWVIYKEASWVSSAAWVVLLFCFGSAATCAYIVTKLFEVTPAGPSQVPLDLLFIRQGNLSQRKCSYVIIGRVIFSILGIFMATVVIYTVITDGLPFRKELLTPFGFLTRNHLGYQLPFGLSC
ncbi:hypothetical protein PVAP13_4KG294100 [Panicum virgatum]|uniref:Uncharacterized protein n=1 Tax=Panicum virgatum TaxID=38727 RepID=A0A8T0TQY6_PANVG|nr:hypothetical protein PVAP13_4KG294100 [Panicum virgatum]